jgi:hypothetical protein
MVDVAVVVVTVAVKEGEEEANCCGMWEISLKWTDCWQPTATREQVSGLSGNTTNYYYYCTNR